MTTPPVNIETGIVSTIIPVYNRAALLAEAVASVLDQQYGAIEIIIVDDGSTDDTGEVARRLAAAHPGRIRVIHQHRAGPGAARQAGLEVARGEFIQFLDSDDLLLPDKFALQVTALRRNPSAGISYGLTLAEDLHSDQRRVTHGTDHPRERLFPAVINGRIWATCSPLYRATVCRAIGPWSRRRVLEDWDYDCRAGLLDVVLHYCKMPLAKIRRGHAHHAGAAWQHDAQIMHDRIAAYMAVASYARRAGLDPLLPEVQRFARSLFWMARVAACHGYTKDSWGLLDLARGFARPPAWDLRLYRLGSRLIGPRWMANLANRLAGDGTATDTT